MLKQLLSIAIVLASTVQSHSQHLQIGVHAGISKWLSINGRNIISNSQGYPDAKGVASPNLSFNKGIHIRYSKKRISELAITHYSAKSNAEEQRGYPFGGYPTYPWSIISQNNTDFIDIRYSVLTPLHRKAKILGLLHLNAIAQYSSTTIYTQSDYFDGNTTYSKDKISIVRPFIGIGYSLQYTINERIAITGATCVDVNPLMIQSIRDNTNAAFSANIGILYSIN